MRMRVKKIIIYMILMMFSFSFVGCKKDSSDKNSATTSEVITEDPSNNELILEETSETDYASSNPDTDGLTTDSTNSDTAVIADAAVIVDDASNASDHSTPTPEDSDVNPDQADKVEPSEEDFVDSLTIASEINKLICVIGNDGADCIVSYHVKKDDGKWTQQFTTDGDNGSKGITYHKKEGDGKTPAGLFSFTQAFGMKSDPGAILPYQQITEHDYWVDDTDSPYYNTWVNSLEIPGDYRSEHLIDHTPQYNYVLNIDYNPDCTPGLGSAIFLHGYNGKGKTTGCIAISEKYMKILVKEVDSSTMILIVPDSDDLVDY